MEPISMTTLSRRIKAAGIKDEWEVLLRLAGNDHTAAFMLRRSILWSNNAKVKKANGWFFRRDTEWRRDDGLTRNKLTKARAILKELKLIEVNVQRVLMQTDLLLGKTMTHYRVIPSTFWAAVQSVIEDMTGTVPAPAENEKPDSADSEKKPDLRESECLNPAFTGVETEHSEVPESNICEYEDPSDATGENAHLNQISLEKSPNDKTPVLNLSSSETHIIDQFRDRYKVEGWNEERADIIREFERLGMSQFMVVLCRCDKKVFGHWSYVTASLMRELVEPPPPTPSPKITTIRSWAREHFNDVPEWFAAELAATT